MEIINIKNNLKYLDEYITLCYLEWSNKQLELYKYIEYKKDKILNDDNVICFSFLMNYRLFNILYYGIRKVVNIMKKRKKRY